MRWIGCDVHKDYLFCVHLDADGGVLAEETVTAQYSAVKTWVETLDPGATTIALESCYAWEYVHDLAEARGIRVLVEAVRRNVAIDWTERESVKAKLRVMVKRVLKKHGYPPDRREKATLTVLAQAEVLCADWVA